MGHLAVIEGLDGSGKATQATHLAAYLQELGQTVRHVAFPNYDHESSALVRLYLSGSLGSPDEVNAYAASSFYAADRYISFTSQWKKDYDAGHTIIADRYTTSNAVHQASKLPPEERGSFLDWLFDLEYCRLGLPRPDLVLYLDLPTELSEQMLRQRERSPGVRADIHEQDDAYLRGCRESARQIARELNWTVVDCARAGRIRPAEEIHEELWNRVAEYL